MYVRNLRKPSPVKNLFRFASTKSSELIMCESSLEFDACFHLEYNEDILTFQSQPEGFGRLMRARRVVHFTPRGSQSRAFASAFAVHFVCLRQ